MHNPYKYYLDTFLDSDGGMPDRPLSIDRNGASTVTGKLVEMDEMGCKIKHSVDFENQSADETYIAYKDIRGVKHTAWDLDQD